MSGFEWLMPTRVEFGVGAVDRVRGEIDALGARRVLLVTGSESMVEAGVVDRIQDRLEGLEVLHHLGVRPNLPISDLEALIWLVREAKPEALIGLGGGSVLDGAKAAALIGPSGQSVRDWLDGFSSDQSLPLIAIPTTSGTGSEVTPFIILMAESPRRKLSLASPAAYPRVALVDPELAATMPGALTASTGLDAISHGLESYWSKRATPPSDALALESVRVAAQNLGRAFYQPDDLEARARMSYAATVAGMALAQTATAALHGLTYPLTTNYDVPHGFACAFLLKEVMRINFHHLEFGKQQRLLLALESNNIEAAIGYLDSIMREVGAPDSLESLGLGSIDLEAMADQATPKNLERNLAPFPRAKILELWRKKIGR